jgi:hypothetical protein
MFILAFEYCHCSVERVSCVSCSLVNFIAILLRGKGGGNTCLRSIPSTWTVGGAAGGMVYQELTGAFKPSRGHLSYIPLYLVFCLKKTSLNQHGLRLSSLYKHNLFYFLSLLHHLVIMPPKGKGKATSKQPAVKSEYVLRYPGTNSRRPLDPSSYPESVNVK